MDVGDLEGCQLTVEDLDLVNQPILETAVAEPLTDGELIVASAGDVLRKVVANDLARWRGGRRRREPGHSARLEPS